jgi:energy-coupling factor transporter ATP-binding protein EcfA2
MSSDLSDVKDASLALEVRGLSYSYPGGRVALRDVALRVHVGEKVGLMGPNGAGKSTLLLHLNGTLPSRHAVWVMDTEVEEHNLGRVRARLGLVFDNPDDQLFSPTVFEDVAYGPLYMGLPEVEVRERVTLALAQVGLSGFEKRLPHHLSLGERKRAAIATVLAMQPDILVLDEPSGGLDPRGRRSLIALLSRLPQTMLIASHDLRLVADLCPRTVILDEGRVVVDGPTARILTDTAFMEAHGLEGLPAMMATSK